MLVIRPEEEGFAHDFWQMRASDEGGPGERERSEPPLP
jgi:hypothetical protein